MSKTKDYIYDNLDVFEYVPEYLKNKLNSSFSRNLFNKFITKEESIPMYGLIGDKPKNPNDTRQIIEQVTTERKINSLIPMVVAKDGADDVTLAFSDIIAKAKLLGINVKDFANWGACESFNFVPPIDIDKFINFSSYFWYGHLTKSQFRPGWNANLEPEYYVISQPSINDVNKIPVEIATTNTIVLTGCGQPQEDWIVAFNSPSTFTVSGSVTGGEYAGTVDEVFSNAFLSFKISSGNVPFTAGDTFTITIHQLRDDHTISYNGKGNGGISGVKGNLSFQIIDGVKTYPGQRVLVKNQTDAGIYIVGVDNWVRAEDCATDESVKDGVRVFVAHGTQAGLYESLPVETVSELAFVKCENNYRNISEWTEYNCWAHKDDLASLGIDINKAIQAKRPIIEYSISLEMSTDAANGAPAAGNVLFNAVQKKIRFNQLPLFNLYLANGDFASKISSIFYYEEDSTSPIDAFMKRRIKLDSNNDYIFSQGCVDESGIMMFFKRSGNLESVWLTGKIEHPKYVTGETYSEAVEIAVDEEMNQGVWKTPFQLEFNPYHENRKSIHFGDLISHFKSIISKQEGFSGSPFGRNNFRQLQNKDLGIGGKIKEHNGAFNKFVGLINQDNISPISIIDFAESQYAQALNSVGEYVNSSLLEFINEHGAPVFSGNFDTTDFIRNLYNAYCEHYKNRVDISSYLSSSTSPIPNWPATLPMLGLSPAVAPHFGFDNELGLNVIVHHDGHLSPKNQRNPEFDRALVKLEVERSDGSKTPGIFSTTAPARPYKNQLWFNSVNGGLYCYNVLSDSTAPNSPALGEYWYDRNSNVLYTWTSNGWVAETSNTKPWVLVETEKILNELILTVEEVLFAGVHPFQELKWDSSQGISEDDLKFELAKFSAKYEYDPYAPTYEATDAFSWNYKQANFPIIGDGYARWHEAYKAYFKSTVGVETCRPNLEPWVLFGSETKPIWFDNEYAGLRTFDPSLSLTDVNVIHIDPIADFSSCPNIVDGVQLTVGTRILVIEAANSKNGIYVVQNVGTGNNGVWDYAADFNPQDLVIGANVKIRSGNSWAETIWSVTGTSPVQFTQVRQWDMRMWAEILNSHPTLKLCVNIFNEQLLPPYVNGLAPTAPFSLLNEIPEGVDASYQFGDNGPTELVWKKSIEHSYSLLRCGMRNLPLAFIENTWGDAYRTINNFKIDKQSGKKLSHKEFVLHGEVLETKNRAGILVCNSLSNSGSVKKIRLLCDLVTDEKDFFQVYINESFVGYLHQLQEVMGVDFSSFQITDSGLGFEIGDSIDFIVESNDQISNVQFNPAKQKTYVGLGQLFTQLLKYNSYSLSESRNNTMFRGWDIRLGHRFGAFVKTEGFTIGSDFFDIPLGLCKFVTKVNPFERSSWLDALRIQLVQVGSTTLEDGIYKPKGNGDDWVFRIETYFNKYPKISYYKFDTTQSYQTFFALEKRRSSGEWKHYLDIASVETATTPFTITGIQNVVSFLFGYVAYLSDQGWKINIGETPDIDAETGRTITWQLEIEKFIDAVYDNMIAGTGTIVNPFMKNVWFQTPFGLMSKFETINFLDITASQFAYDILGSQLSINDLKVVREEDLTTIISDIPMYGLHVNVESYEHAILFPYYLNNAKRENLIYDPFLGLRLNRLMVNGRRQAVQSGRPSFGGFYLHNNQMKRNIVASIDDLGKIYDAEFAFNNPNISKHSLALFGYQGKDYFKDLGTSDKTQFNFWRGMIQAKGTNMSVDAFLNNSSFEDAMIDEYWAFKVAEYGDARTKSFPELKLNISDCLLDHTRFQFTDGLSVEGALPGFIQVSTTDESRWINLDDLDELKERGMYFDAISLGKIIIKEKPQFGSLENLGNGLGKFADGTQTVKTFISPTTIRVIMTDVVNFKVENDLTGALIGTGSLGLTFESADFTFMIESDYIDLTPGDVMKFEIHEDIESFVKLPFIADKLVFSDPDSIEMVTSTIVKVKRANTSITVEGFGPQKPKFSPIKFFDYSTDTSLGNISFWHPAIGQHTPEAFEIINVTSPNDPAKYNETIQAVNNANYDVLKPWGKKEVGKVWWNTKGLDYTPYYDSLIYPDFESRISKWGALSEYSSVNVYEWVESDVPPSKYNDAVAKDLADASISQNNKKSGEAAISKLLTRNRSWYIRPIAWTKNEQSATTPFLTSALFNKVKLLSTSIGDSKAILNFGRFSDFGIADGMKLSGWDFINEIPVGEAKIVGNESYVFGSEYTFFTPRFTSGSVTITETQTVTTTTSHEVKSVASINVTAGGNGYTSAPTVTISGGGGTGAKAVANLTTELVTGVLQGLELISAGDGYELGDSTPVYVQSPDGGDDIEVGRGYVFQGSVSDVYIDNSGLGLLDGTYPIFFSGSGGTGAAANAIVSNGELTSVEIVNSGSGYSGHPMVTVSIPFDSNAPTKISPSLGTAEVTGPITTLTYDSYISGYDSAPSVTIGGTGSGATGYAVIANEQVGKVSSITVTDPGTGYTSTPIITISGGGGSGARGAATVQTSTVEVTETSTVEVPKDLPIIITVDKSDKASSIGKALGKIIFSYSNTNGQYWISALEMNTGISQSLPALEFVAGQIGYVDYDFGNLGFKLRLSMPTGVSLSSEKIAKAIGVSSHDFYIREAIDLDVMIDLPDDILVNDQNDEDSLHHNFGWRAWKDPTQAELDEDLRKPDNLWEPIFGEFVKVENITTSYLAEIKAYQDNKPQLNNGTIIEKYKSVWGEYTELFDTVVDFIYSGDESDLDIAFANEKTLDKNRIFVYFNGIIQPTSSYKIVKNVVKVEAAVVGTKIVAIYKKYQPTADELKFDPETKDDIYTNTQFTFGYDYTSLAVRDENGKISKTLYYFWVKNKNTAVLNKSMSVLQAKNLLTFGPSMYMTFHNMSDSAPFSYNAVTIFGINKFVGRDNTYKIRFTRNFTLRDDPNELDLKNVHAEWTLLRQAQNVRVPNILWEKMVDSACGRDIIGNLLPSQYLSDYDSRHGSANRFGLGAGQVLAESQSIIDSIKFTILNTQLTLKVGGSTVPDYIQVLNLSQLDKYFDTPETIRKTLDLIWREARPKQINEIFFAVINDALANNFEFKDIFKTSRLSIYSIKTVQQILTGTTDE